MANKHSCIGSFTFLGVYSTSGAVSRDIFESVHSENGGNWGRIEVVTAVEVFNALAYDSVPCIANVDHTCPDHYLHPPDLARQTGMS